MESIEGKVALITGASRGIGRAVAVKLAEMGVYSYVNFVRNEEAARETMDLISAGGGTGSLLPFDVADLDSVNAAMDGIIKEKGRIDILVNNAGITLNGIFIRTKEADWNAVIDINMKGTFNCARCAIRHMMKQRWGRIVNMTSVVAETGNAGQACYAATKSGIIGFTRSLAREFGSRNICVNAVAPGYIETDMTATINERNREKLKEHIPLQRMGTPGDVAAAVAFLVSPEAGYITGQVIRVNGGLYM